MRNETRGKPSMKNGDLNELLSEEGGGGMEEEEQGEGRRYRMN